MRNRSSCAAAWLFAALISAAGAIPAAAMPSSAAHSTAAPTPANRALEIEVAGLRDGRGQVGCSIFSDRKAFPADDSKVLRHVWASIHGGRAVCRYPGLAAGDYAAVVYHDENGNGKFDRNFLGMPKEGFGFSRDAPVRFSAPTFDACHFLYDGRGMRIVIHIRYWPL
ncbi:MAG: DUF2141 domain-containing protein [Candidatus Binataceae bacterium]